MGNRNQDLTVTTQPTFGNSPQSSALMDLYANPQFGGGNPDVFGQLMGQGGGINQNNLRQSSGGLSKLQKAGIILDKTSETLNSIFDTLNSFQQMRQNNVIRRNSNNNNNTSSMINPGGTYGY